MNPNDFKVDITDALMISGEGKVNDLFVLDGGRTSLYCENSRKFFWIRLVTNGSLDKPFEAGYWPGGLYINNDLIKINSEEERNILTFLKGIKPPKSWYDNSFNLDGESTNHGIATEKHIQFLINFIQSSKYQELGVITERGSV